MSPSHNFHVYFHPWERKESRNLCSHGHFKTQRAPPPSLVLGYRPTGGVFSCLHHDFCLMKFLRTGNPHTHMLCFSPKAYLGKSLSAVRLGAAVTMLVRTQQDWGWVTGSATQSRLCMITANRGMFFSLNYISHYSRDLVTELCGGSGLFNHPLSYSATRSAGSSLVG